ncbi:ribokinase [Ligilactobacillus murinus]|uniref:Ribokinase n=1 Tax=Ligilactobacillus murinus TaxID=1622 RepID=A0A4Q2ALU6_9LACO|nr:ribokinase [Ligilactobacillus murinus]NBH86304.1 ribokinase [Lachnospiraceae bacterium]MBF0758458.1 ribokinase [Ligilactobacillus murinus]MBF0831367.1 ribokinase [Ligilactobacillus murinus]RXV70515.1 ribokinase [Ligilactobacillus murinus]TFU64047.1 ribokinase [Ligilactobacillus murinus]
MVNRVTVLGSLNVDNIMQVKRLPLPGETMTMSAKKIAGGGKGANQAIAAARSGAQTAFIGKVGADEQGRLMKGYLEDAKIDATSVTLATEETGQAFILLQENGENSILVLGGANQAITDDDIEAAKEKITTADFLITQFETPIEASITAFKYAKENDVVTILNPAPAKRVPEALLKNVDLIVLNETETELLTGIKIDAEESWYQAAAKLAKMGVKNTIITLGSKGAYYKTTTAEGFIKAFKVATLDTTAAGDTFLGALSSQLDKALSNIEEAIVFASMASALAVQKLGAIPSIPQLNEVNDALGEANF